MYCLSMATSPYNHQLLFNGSYNNGQSLFLPKWTIEDAKSEV